MMASKYIGIQKDTIALPKIRQTTELMNYGINTYPGSRYRNFRVY